MNELTYEQILDAADHVAARYRAVHGREPGAQDIAHNLFRFMREGWTLQAILDDIGPAPVTPQPPTPPQPQPPSDVPTDEEWERNEVRPTIRAVFVEIRGAHPTKAQEDAVVEKCYAPPRGEGWHVEQIRAHVRSLPPDAPKPAPVDGRVRRDGEVFRRADGSIWQWRGATMFLLFRRWLNGENISSSIEWMRRQHVNVARVLCMVGWKGYEFGPSTDAFYHQLRDFCRELGAHGINVEVVAFADAQIVMPHLGDQQRHMQNVVNAVGDLDNVFIEVCNEPWQNGVDAARVGAGVAARCPMAYGDYDFHVVQTHDGVWRAELAFRDYLTLHTPRDPHAWARKAKDLLEMRKGSGTGEAANAPIWPGSHCPVVDDEPMGAAESGRVAGRQRSANPNEHFWHHAVAAMFCAGSTFHFDDGMYGHPPQELRGDQQRCADAVTLAWTRVPAEAQAWQYSRSGLPDFPLAWEPHLFPEETSRMYAMIGGNKAVAVAVHPLNGWRAAPVNGWRIVSASGPIESLVILER
jgi:hypothetical protein